MAVITEHAVPPSGALLTRVPAWMERPGRPLTPTTDSTRGGWFSLSSHTARAPSAIHAPPNYLLSAHNFQILTSSPDLPVLCLLPLQTYAHVPPPPPSRVSLGPDCGSPTPFLLSPPLSTLFPPTPRHGSLSFNEDLAWESLPQALHPGNLTYDTFYLNIPAQDPTVNLKFNKPQAELTAFAPSLSPPPRTVLPLTIQPGCHNQTPESIFSSCLFPTPSITFTEEAWTPPNPSSSLPPLDRGPGQHPFLSTLLQQPRAPD